MEQVRSLSVMVAMSLLFGCATASGPDGAEPADGDAGSGGASAASLSAGAGDPGAAGPSSAGPGGGAAAGNGGAASSASASSASSSAGGSPAAGSGGGGQGGSAPASATHVVFLAGGGTSTVGSYVDVTTNMGWSWPIVDATYDVISVTAADGTAYGVYRAFPSDELRFSTWTTKEWAPGQAIESGLLTGSAPAAFAVGDDVHVVYQQAAGGYAYARSQSGLWSPKSELVAAPAAAQSEGPAAPAMVVLGAEVVLIFVAEDAGLRATVRAAAQWQPEAVIAAAGAAAPLAPVLVAPDAGPELLAVFVDAATGAVRWTARSGGVWSAPADVTGAVTAEPPALVALEGGDALLSFRGADGKPWTARWSAGAWGAPVLAADVLTVPCPARIARGAQGAEAELVYVDTIGAAYWSRLVGGVWTAGGLAGVASSPSCMSVGTL